MSTVENRQSWGNFLLTLAWILVVVEVLISSMIGWSFGYQTYEFYVQKYGEFESFNYFDLVLASLPFLMVAAVCLTVIPICYRIYTRDIKVKIIFSVVLLAVTFITFETLVVGLERQFNNSSKSVVIPQGKLDAVLEDIQLNNELIKNLESFSIESIEKEVAIRRQDAKENFDKDIQILHDQIQHALTAGEPTLVPQIRKLIEDRALLVQHRSDQIKQIKDQIKALEESLMSDSEQAIPKLKNKIKEIEDFVDEGLKRITEQLEELKKQQIEEKETYKKINNLESLIVARHEEYTDEIKEIDKYRQSQLDKLAQSDERKDELKVTLTNLEKEKIGLQQELYEAYKDTQIYRIAQSAYDLEEDEYISKAQIATVAKLWFGSLGGIIVLIPILLAFGAFRVKYGTQGKAEQEVIIKDNEEKK